MAAILQIMFVDRPRTSNSDADKCIIIHFSKVSNTMRVYTNVRKVAINLSLLFKPRLAFVYSLT